GAGPPQAGRLRATAAPSATGPPQRVPRAHREAGRAEPSLGVPAHPGRTAQAGPSLLPLDRPQSAPPPRSAARPSSKSAVLARVRAPARRSDPGLRLLRRGHSLAGPALRPLLYRDRQPARSPGGLQQPPDRRLGGPTGTEPGLEAAGGGTEGQVPAPGSGHQVQRRLRRGLPLRGAESHPPALPAASGEGSRIRLHSFGTFRRE